MCNFFNKIFNKLASFIGNTMGSMIPNSAGIPGILVPILLKNFKGGAIDVLESQVKKYYNKIPHTYKSMIKNPKLMKKFLDSKIKKGKKFLFGQTKDLANILFKNTYGFSYSIHKFMALIFSLFYILKICIKNSN